MNIESTLSSKITIYKYIDTRRRDSEIARTQQFCWNWVQSREQAILLDLLFLPRRNSCASCTKSKQRRLAVC